MNRTRRKAAKMMRRRSLGAVVPSSYPMIWYGIRLDGTLGPNLTNNPVLASISCSRTQTRQPTQWTAHWSDGTTTPYPPK